MTIGIKVIGTNAVQIDETYQNIQLVEVRKNIRLTDLLNYSLGLAYLDITSRPNCVVALRSQGYMFTTGLSQARGPGTQSLVIESNVTNASSELPFDLFIFDTGQIPPASGVGMKVNTAAGVPAFYSGAPDMRVVEQISFASEADWHTGRSRTYDSSRLYAVATAHYGLYAAAVTNAYLFTTQFRHQSGGVQITYQQAKSGIVTGNQGIPFVLPTYLMIDVTDF